MSGPDKKDKSEEALKQSLNEFEILCDAFEGKKEELLSTIDKDNSDEMSAALEALAFQAAIMIVSSIDSGKIVPDDLTWDGVLELTKRKSDRKGYAESAKVFFASLTERAVVSLDEKERSVLSDVFSGSEHDGADVKKFGV